MSLISGDAIITSLSAVQIYDFHIFTAVYSPLHGFIWNQHSDQLPVGLLAQLVERCTGIAEVMGSNPVQAWIFFRPSFHYCLSSVHYCEDRFHIHVFIRSSNIWLSYIHSRRIQTVLHHWYITWQNDSLLLERSSKILRTLSFIFTLVLYSRKGGK